MNLRLMKNFLSVLRALNQVPEERWNPEIDGRRYAWALNSLAAELGVEILESCANALPFGERQRIAPESARIADLAHDALASDFAELVGKNVSVDHGLASDSEGIMLSTDVFVTVLDTSKFGKLTVRTEDIASINAI